MQEKTILPYPFVTREMLDFSHASTFGLLLQVMANTTNPIEIRGFTKAGPFVFHFVPAGNSSLETFPMSLPDLPIAVSVSYDFESAQEFSTHATLLLRVNGETTVILAQGIISGIYGISYPHQLARDPEQANGIQAFFIAANPAAGAEVSVDLPANEIWEIDMVQMTLTASASAANRVPTLNFLPGGIPFISRANTTNITANQAVTILWIRGGTTAVITAAALHEVALPANIRLSQQSDITTLTSGIQVGDQYSDIIVYGRKYYGAS